MSIAAILSAAANEIGLDIVDNEREFMAKLNEIMNSLDATPEAVDFEVKADD